MTMEDECRAPHGAFAFSAAATSGGALRHLTPDERYLSHLDRADLLKTLYAPPEGAWRALKHAKEVVQRGGDTKNRLHGSALWNRTKTSSISASASWRQ